MSTTDTRAGAAQMLGAGANNHAQGQRVLRNVEHAARFGATLRTTRLRAGITQDAAAKATHVTRNTWISWELGLRAPLFWRLPHIAATLGEPVAALLGETPGQACVAEVWVSRATLSEVRKGGRAHALDVAERIGRGLEPLVWQAATGRLPRAQDTPARSKPRRSRAQVLAGLDAANKAATAARLAYAQGELQRIEAERITDDAQG